MTTKNPTVKVIGEVRPTKCWSTDEVRVKECERAPKVNPIRLQLIVHEKVAALLDRLHEKEWLVYLVGVEMPEYFSITDLLVPEQVVTGVSVDVQKPISRADIIGTLHLHPFGGKPSLSSTDEEYICGNHPITIVINPQQIYTAQIETKLPCGSPILVDAEVVVVHPIRPDLTAFVEAAVPLITEKVWAPQHVKGVVVAQGDYPYWYNPSLNPNNQSSFLYCGKCHKPIPASDGDNYAWGVRYCGSCFSAIMANEGDWQDDYNSEYYQGYYGETP